MHQEPHGRIQPGPSQNVTISCVCMLTGDKRLCLLCSVITADMYDAWYTLSNDLDEDVSYQAKALTARLQFRLK